MKERIVSRPDAGYDEALPAYGERVPYSRQSGNNAIATGSLILQVHAIYVNTNNSEHYRLAQ